MKVGVGELKKNMTAKNLWNEQFLRIKMHKSRWELPPSVQLMHISHKWLSLFQNKFHGGFHGACTGLPIFHPSPRRSGLRSPCAAKLHLALPQNWHHPPQVQWRRCRSCSWPRKDSTVMLVSADSFEKFANKSSNSTHPKKSKLFTSWSLKEIQKGSPIHWAPPCQTIAQLFRGIVNLHFCFNKIHPGFLWNRKFFQNTTKLRCLSCSSFR